MTAADHTPSPKPHHCPRCRSQELSVIEVHDEHGETDPGEVFIVDGRVQPPSDFWFNPGDPTYTGFHCADCDHQWRSRWPVGVFKETHAGPCRGERPASVEETQP